MKKSKVISVLLACFFLLVSCVGEIISEDETCLNTDECDVTSSSQIQSSTALSESNVISAIEKSSEELKVSSSVVISATSSSELLSSSSFALSSFDYQGSQFEVNAWALDEWGLVGEDKKGIVTFDIDNDEGGSSLVLDLNGEAIGPCPIWYDTRCNGNWNMTSTFQMIDYSVSYVELQFLISDYASYTKATLGEAFAGFWVVPEYAQENSGETAFEKTKPIGLTEESWLQFVISYTQGEELTIELMQEGVDADKPPFKAIYTGTGNFETIDIPLSSFKRENGIAFNEVDASKVTAIGFVRREVVKEGESSDYLPEGTPNKTVFKFECLAAGAGGLGVNLGCGNPFAYDM